MDWELIAKIWWGFWFAVCMLVTVFLGGGLVAELGPYDNAKQGGVGGTVLAFVVSLVLLFCVMNEMMKLGPLGGLW